MSSREARRAPLLIAFAVAIALIGAEQVAAHPAIPMRGKPAPVPPKVQELFSAPVQRAAEPPLDATPQAPCGRGSRPETGLQGRVSRADADSGRAAEGYTCNTEKVGRFGDETPYGTIGGFKVERYVDADGHECAYYDTTLLYPTNFLDQEGGVNVLDMSDPTHPRLTAQLITPAMLTPHESLVLSKQRGLLAAVAGNAATFLGQVDVYDLSKDCRHPILKSTSPVGIAGHESGLAPDGKTFYSASPVAQTIVGVDLDNPSLPVPIWAGSYPSHGLSVSNDGDRAYVAGIGTGLIILDTSQVQDRVPNPKVKEIARLRWNSMSIPQNAIPVTIHGRDYVVEVDEFGTLDQVGAARIIDIEDETKPHVVSNLRLEVHQKENFEQISGDPAASNPLQGYAAHYCNVPKRKNPGIAACSMILSGLRIFDIRDPKHPKEIAYFNSPIPPRAVPAFEASNWAMSSPSFVPSRGEIWYSDGFTGFWNVHLTNGVWPFPSCGGAVSTISGLDLHKRGTNGVDRIVGSGGSAKVPGAGGADRITARGANDYVCARSGRDRINAGGGSDSVRGQRGGDRIAGGAGADVLRGGYGRDRISGGPGADRIVCGLGGADVAFVEKRDSVVSGCEKVRPAGA
jgi:hypothetical protein